MAQWGVVLRVEYSGARVEKADAVAPVAPVAWQVDTVATQEVGTPEVATVATQEAGPPEGL